MSTQYPPLPYRRLKMMANGIWDEAKKAFYPFTVSTATVTGKTGIRYFVKSAMMTGANTGDHTVANMNWYSVINKQTVVFCPCTIPVTTAASNVSAGNSLACEVNLLLDANAAITRGVDSASSYQAVIVYAEIPDDLGWVVVE